MLKIGDFSKLSMVSVRMLRFYDENGLLNPVRVDKFTGYRYYSVEQLKEVSQIKILQGLGISLSEIKVLKQNKFLKPQMVSALNKIYEIKKQEYIDLSDTLHSIERTIGKIERNEFMLNYKVELKTMPERQTAAVREVIKQYSDEGMLWEKLYTNINANKVKVSEKCYPMTVYLDKEYKEENPYVEVSLTVDGEYKDTDVLKFSKKEKQLVASVTFSGHYEQITDIYAIMAEWIESGGYSFDGEMFLLYIKSPSEAENESELVSELCIPVKKI